MHLPNWNEERGRESRTVIPQTRTQGRSADLTRVRTVPEWQPGTNLEESLVRTRTWILRIRRQSVVSSHPEH